MRAPRSPRFAPPRATALAFALLSLALAAARPGSACSMCRCGDPTFNALGTDVYAAGNFRLALDWERFEKEQGVAETHVHPQALADPADGARERESEVENRLTATLSWAFADRFNLVARIPQSDRRLTAADGGVETSRDLSDPEIYGLVRLWSSGFAGGLGRRAWISGVAGVKTPWGRNDLRGEAGRLEEHLQSGTGSTDVFGGLSGVYLFDDRSALFGSTQVRRTGGNDFGYRYGDVLLANLGYERKLNQRLDALVELNYRDAGRDRISSEEGLDPNTGGGVLYLTPRASVDLGRGLVARLAVQLPVADSLHGDQKEKAVANVGITYLLR